jgi:Transposase family tnp2
LWTVSDLPSYEYLLGYSVQGEFGCPNYNIGTCSIRLKHGYKLCFMDHRRFLEKNHPFRFDKKSFDGTEELKSAPRNELIISLVHIRISDMKE